MLICIPKDNDTRYKCRKTKIKDKRLPGLMLQGEKCYPKPVYCTQFWIISTHSTLLVINGSGDPVVILVSGLTRECEKHDQQQEKRGSGAGEEENGLVKLGYVRLGNDEGDETKTLMII